MFDSYDYWNNIFSHSRGVILNDWNITTTINKYPKLEGYLVFNSSSKALTDDIKLIGIPSFCGDTLLTLPYTIMHKYHFAYALYVFPRETQLRTKRDFHNLRNFLQSGHVVKVRTSTNRLYYLHNNFILNDKKRVLVMPYSFYSYNTSVNTGYRRVKRELYVNPVLMAYKHDFIKKMVVHELFESLELFNSSVCIQSMERNLISFYDINKAGFSLDMDYYHDMLSDMMKNQSFINSVIDNL